MHPPGSAQFLPSFLLRNGTDIPGLRAALYQVTMAPQCPVQRCLSLSKMPRGPRSALFFGLPGLVYTPDIST